VFGKFSAWKLSQLTHREEPWLNNYKPGKRDVEIPLDEMYDFFRKKVIVKGKKKKKAEV
jgi:uncharacterized phage-associated protein